jgi:cardiolipin synthase A/B
VRVFESNDTMMHAKTAVIDGVWSTVGSSNLDYRSFLHNDEVNAVVVGAAFGAQMEERFGLDRKASVEITADAWRKRSVLRRANEYLSHAFAYWL